MYQFVLFCKAPTKVEIEGAQFIVSKSKTRVIEIDEQKTFFLGLCAVGDCQTQSIAEINFDGNRFVSKSKSIKLIRHSATKYDIEIQNNYCFEQKRTKKLNFEGIEFTFYADGLVEAENDEEILFSQKFDFGISNAQIESLNENFLCLKLMDGNNCNSIILNKQYYCVAQFNNSILEKTETGCKVLTELKDISRHGVVRIFELGEEMNLVDQYSVYLAGRPINDFNLELLPLYFLQCIKASDFKEAKFCLSEELRQKVDVNHLSSFFGNFESEKLTINEKGYFASLTYRGQGGYISKEYEFKIEKNKIVNILPCEEK